MDNLYPNLVGNPNASNQSLNQWYNQLAFAAPAPDTFGNNKRNSLRGPDLTDVDFSLAKSFGIPGWEQGQLQLRMDAINVLNHPSFRNPSNNLNPTALTSGVPDPSVGHISATTITGRIVQLSCQILLLRRSGDRCFWKLKGRRLLVAVLIFLPTAAG